MTDEKTQVFRARYDQIRAICDFVLAGTEKAGFDKRTRFHLELACDEACTNIVEHAYGGDDKGDIAATWSVTATEYLIRFQDSGISHKVEQSHTEQVEVTQSTAVEDVKVGGLGLRFIYTLMDEVRSERSADGHNVLTMVKWHDIDSAEPVWFKFLDNDIVVIGVNGRLDQLLTPRLDALFDEQIKAGHHRLIVNLSQTDYINSGGLRSLVAAWRQVRQRDGDLILAGLNQNLTEILQMVGFDKLFHLSPTLNHALARFQASKPTAD